MISPDARIINHNTQKTWHYIFAKSTPRALQYQWLIPRTHAATVEDQSDHLFAMLQDHVTRLENTVRWRWSTGDVVMWDNRATQHKAIDDYGEERRIVRRVTIGGPVSVGIDGRHGKRRNNDVQAVVAA